MLKGGTYMPYKTRLDSISASNTGIFSNDCRPRVSVCLGRLCDAVSHRGRLETLICLVFIDDVPN